MIQWLAKSCARCGRRTRDSRNDSPMCIPCQDEIARKAAVDTEGTRVCPIDGTPLAKDVLYHVVIDRCPSCSGIWLDAEELRHLMVKIAGATF